MRTFISYLIVVFPCFIVSSLQAEVTTDVSKIQEICNQAIESRLKIKQWHVKLDCVNSGLHAESRPITYSFYVDGKRKRDDNVFPSSDGTLTEQFHIQNDEYYFSYQKIDGKIDPTLALYQVENKSRYAPKAAFILDFRAFGFSPYGFGVHDDPIRRTLGNIGAGKRVKTVTMQDDVLNKLMCKRITITLIDSGVITFWLAEDCGYAPIRYETQNSTEGFDASTTVELARYKATDIWVPVHMVEKYNPGIPGQEHQTEYTTTVYSINEPIDAKWFSPESLGLPPGTPVVMAAEKPPFGTPVWDGKKTVSEGEMLLEQATNRRVSGYRYGLFAAGLALISLALLLKYFEAGRKEG